MRRKTLRGASERAEAGGERKDKGEKGTELNILNTNIYRAQSHSGVAAR